MVDFDQLKWIPNGRDPSLRFGISEKNLLKPVHSDLKLHSVNSGIRHRQAGVGNMLIADAGCKGAAVVIEELKAQSGGGNKVYVRRIQPHCVVAEKHSAAEFEIRNRAGRTGEVPL